MSLKLYHYMHCPYCVRVRLALGYLGLEYHSVVLPYDDEETPIRLTGKKILPALVKDGVAMNESLDIIATLDPGDSLGLTRARKGDDWAGFEIMLGSLGNLVHSLAMPYWVWAPEFTPTARAYFTAKKSIKRGPFPELARRRPDYELRLIDELERLGAQLRPFWNSESFSGKDLLLVAHLWGLFQVPEFRLPQQWHDLAMAVKSICSFDYQDGFWGWE